MLWTVRQISLSQLAIQRTCLIGLSARTRALYVIACSWLVDALTISMMAKSKVCKRSNSRQTLNLRWYNIYWLYCNPVFWFSYTNFKTRWRTLEAAQPQLGSTTGPVHHVWFACMSHCSFGADGVAHCRSSESSTLDQSGRSSIWDSQVRIDLSAPKVGL